ncbi:MAG: right-handed parallel beta-helix repeat-containing protein, partial [Pedosphaera parvula]|nr:right-handed parallel beta-helix repeat-containing protein [Pedosphaera parvula]
QIGGVGIRLAHNALHDSPHQSILLGGNDHVIEYNEVYRVGMDSDDCGAFYMGRNPSERGNVIRYNYWHDIGSSFAHGSCAVYFDDGTGGQRVHGNVFYRAAGGNFGAVFLHGGHDNWVENNIFIECKRAVGHAPWGDDYWNEWLTGDLWRERLTQEVDITSPLYLERYPELKDFLSPTPKTRVNHLSRNIIVRCGDVMTGNWEASDNMVTEDDPGFADAAAGDFALREDSPVFDLIGNTGDRWDSIGLVVTPLRPVLPEK